MVEKVARSISCLALMEEIMNIIYEKWDEILETVKTEHELSDVSFKTWLKPLTIHSIDDQVVTILVPSQQVGLNYISKKYALPLKVAISELTGSDYDIKFVLPEDIQNVEKEVPVSTNYNTSMEMANLNPKYTFDTFVVGSNNKFAHAASLAVAESPGEIYNPLFLYGGVGLGKTHLMHAIGNRTLKNFRNFKILYVTSEKFTNQMINAIKDNKMEVFRNQYRKIDVLLIDDIQFIAGKKQVQEEFFHTFNELYEEKKQIIISSDRPPKEIQLLEDRLKSRFEWGLLADISCPDYETRLAILRKKAQDEKIAVDDSILANIATKIESNIRELEGVFNKMIARASLMHSPITIELAENTINEFKAESEKVLSSDYVKEIVSKYFSVDKNDLSSNKRSNEIAFPRQIAMYLCRDVANMSYPKIGEDFGNRDHSTVMHACKKIENEIKEKNNTRLIVESVKNIIINGEQ